MTNDIDLKLSKCDLNPGHEYTAVSNNAIATDGASSALSTSVIDSSVPKSTNESYDNAIPKYLTREAQDNNKYSPLQLEKSGCNEGSECCNNCTRNNASAQWYDNARKTYTQSIQDTRNENLCGDKNVQYPAIYKQSGYTSSPFSVYADSVINRQDLNHCNTFGPTPKYLIPNTSKTIVQQCTTRDGVVESRTTKTPAPFATLGNPYGVLGSNSKYKRNAGFVISRTRNLNFSAII